MEPKKVFIVSYNSLTTDYWKQMLNLKDASLWHWKEPEHGVNNLSTVWPDVIIIDGYWASQSYEACLKHALRLKSKVKIFCLDPNGALKEWADLKDDRLVISKLNDHLIASMNQSINDHLSKVHLN